MTNRDKYPRIIFYEEQQFRQKWLWIFLLITCLLVISLIGYGICKQLIGGQPWDDRQLSGKALVLGGILSVPFLTGIFYLFYKLKLITEVRDDGLYVQFFPLSRQKIAFENIKACAARVYSPIKEYFGWGIRYGRKAMVYSVSGNKGVQLEFFSGKPLLISSLNPVGLASAIRVYVSSEELSFK